MYTEDRVLLNAFFSANNEFFKKYFKIEEKLENGELDIDQEEVTFDLPLSSLSNNLNELITKKSINEIYQDLMDGMYFTSSVDLQDILKLLCREYLTVHHNNPDYNYNFIKEHDFKFLYQFFKSNKDFAGVLLSNYYVARIYDIEVNDEELEDDKELLSKFDVNQKVMILTDYLRMRYEMLVNLLIEYNVPEEDIMKIIYCLLTDKKVLVINDEIDEEFNFLREYKRTYLRMIYSDLYEDLPQWGEQMPNYDIMKSSILYAVNNNSYHLPDSEIGIDLVGRFTDLVFEPYTREYNRNCLNKDEIKILKKTNPCYQLERVMLGYENK